MNKRRMPLPFVVVAVAAVVLSGCTGSGEPPEDAPTTLRVGFAQEPTSMVPSLSYGSRDIATLDLVYDRLIVLDQETGELLPDAGVASEWGFSDDNLTFTMTIKPDITFQDGTPLDADAVVTSLEFARNTAEVQPLAPKELGAIESIEATGGNTVEITLSEPFAPLPAVLASPPGMVVSPAALEEFDDVATADLTGMVAALAGAGSGPYRFVTWNKGVDWSLEANPDYWGEAAAFETVEFTLMTDRQAQLNALQADEVDVVFDIDPVQAPTLEGDENVRVDNEPNQAVSSFNIAQAGPFADPLVRQAINIAIDREALASAIFPTIEDAVDQFPTNIPSPQQAWPATKRPPLVFDIERARDLMEEAGYGDGLAMETCAGSADVVMQTADEILREQLAEIGITTNINLQPSVGPCNTGTAAGQYQGFYGTVQGQYDPYLLYRRELTTAVVGGSYPIADAALALVARASTREDQIAAYGLLNAEWQDSVPVVILFSRPMLVGYDAALEGSAVGYTGEWTVSRLRF